MLTMSKKFWITKRLVIDGDRIYKSFKTKREAFEYLQNDMKKQRALHKPILSCYGYHVRIPDELPQNKILPF